MPRKPGKSSTESGNKPRVRFIFEPDRTSPNGITYSWLIHGTYNGKEKAATALGHSGCPLLMKPRGSTQKMNSRNWPSNPSGRWRLKFSI